MATNDRTRVVIAEDHTFLREVLVEMLDSEDDFEVVGSAGTGEEAVQLSRLGRPDLLLLDLDLPEMAGATVVRSLRAQLPGMRVVVLTGQPADDHARTMLRLGVDGFLAKTTSRDELLAALRAVVNGATVLHTPVAGMLRRQAGLAPESDPTARELDVLRLVAQGLRNREIAEQLDIGESTVEFHLRNLFRKLSVATRTELVHQARLRGWAA